MKRGYTRAYLAIAIVLCVGSALARADDIHVIINGEPVRFQGIGPQEVQGRVMVPLRGVLEQLGAFVDWVPATQTVVASKGNMDMQLRIGSATAHVNGSDVPLDVPAMTIGGRTMVPLRFVGETLGADVRWDASTQTVLITTNGRPTTPTQPLDDPPTREPRIDTTPLTVDSLTHNSRDAWLKSGETIEVTMQGTPHGEASFRIPGVIDAVPLREVSPGVYKAQWTVPGEKNVQIEDAAIIGSLRRGERTSPLLQDGDMLHIDTVRPVIADLSPTPDSKTTRLRPLISATFSDQGGSGIDEKRTKITVNGRDVTGSATVTEHFFSYTPPEDLSAQQDTVDLYVYDRAGNLNHRTWSFDVATRRSGIKSVKTNAEGTLEPGDVVNVRMEGTPGNRATFSLGSTRDHALIEESPGVYTGSYTIRKGDDVISAPIIVTLVTPDGDKFTDTTGRAIRVITGPPAAPVITSPMERERIRNPLVVRGTAAPNTTVRLRIAYANRVLGLVAVRGTVAQVDVPVDKNGRWESQPLDISTLLNSRDTDYTLTAITITPNEEKSSPTTLRIRAQ